MPLFSTSTAAGRIGRAAALATIMLAHPAVSAAVCADVVIAVAGPASGRLSPVTDATSAGVRRATDAINATGGINGQRLSVEVHDDGCEAAKATTLATALAARKVALVVGHPCTAAALAAAKVYGEKSIVFIANATRHPSLTSPRAGATIFRLSGRDDKQGEDAAAHLAAQFTSSKIAIVHDRTRYARTIAEDTAIALTKAGGTAPASPPVTATLIASEKDFPLVTAKIKDAGAIFYAGFPLEAGLLHAQLRAAGSKAVFLMSDSNATEEFAATFGASTKAVRVMRPLFGIDDTHHDVSAHVRLRDASASLAARAVGIFAEAAKGAGPNDPAKIAEMLSARPNSTQAGTVAFESNGDAKRPSFDVYTWTGTNWERGQP